MTQRKAAQKGQLVKIIYSGFDTIYFAIQGALSQTTLKRLDSLKEHNARDETQISFQIENNHHRYFLQSSGKKGGYTHVINTGGADQL